MNEMVNVVSVPEGFGLEWADGEPIPGVYTTEEGAARCAEEFAAMYVLFCSDASEEDARVCMAEYAELYEFGWHRSYNRGGGDQQERSS